GGRAGQQERTFRGSEVFVFESISGFSKGVWIAAGPRRVRRYALRTRHGHQLCPCYVNAGITCERLLREGGGRSWLRTHLHASGIHRKRVVVQSDRCAGKQVLELDG